MYKFSKHSSNNSDLIEWALVPVVFARNICQLRADATVDRGEGTLCRSHQLSFETLPEEVEAAHRDCTLEVPCKVGLDYTWMYAVSRDSSTCKHQR